MALSNRLLSRSLFGARSVFPLTITTRFKINDLGDDAQLAYQKKREIEEKKKQEKNKNLQLKKEYLSSKSPKEIAKEKKKIESEKNKLRQQRKGDTPDVEITYDSDGKEVFAEVERVSKRKIDLEDRERIKRDDDDYFPFG